MAGAERSKGSKVGRLVRYFREADLDEARVALELAERALADRLKPQAAPAARRPRKTRRAQAVDAAAVSASSGTVTVGQ